MKRKYTLKRDNAYMSWKIILAIAIIFNLLILTNQTKLTRNKRGLRIYRRQLNHNNDALQAKPATNILDTNIRNPRFTVPKITKSELKEAITKATEKVRKRFDVIESRIFSSGEVQTPGSAGWFAAASANTKIIAKNYSYSALISEEATVMLSKKYKLNRDQISFGLPTIDIKDTSLGERCPLKRVTHPCQPGKYRSYSGHCNNVQNPEWGNANTPYLRLLAPNYFDSVSFPRQSISGNLLPSARDVSLSIHQGTDNYHSHMTTLTTFFGEFIFHDLAHTAQTVGYKGHRIKCCGLKEERNHPECMPINVRPDDPVFSDIGQNCMDYIRSCQAIRTGCTLGPREQINQVTSFLDASTVYGSSEEESQSLRKFTGGKLTVQQTSSGRELLPEQSDNKQDCKSLGKVKCFSAGDIRVNENLGLTIIHTLFMREHNRIARKLVQINPHWADNQLFEESRRILIAEVQHITYNEFLPSVLGQQTIDKYDLLLLNNGFFQNYNINANPSVANGVASAVFAVLFSTVPSKMERYSQELQNLGSIKMGDVYYDPTEIYRSNKFDEYLMGMISQNAMGSDPLVTNEMTNGIFEQHKQGIDFVALIIQQGRDHGLPGYTEWRKFCDIPPVVETFNDLIPIMKSETVKKLTRLYSNVHDIDLFTGGLSEKPLKGALVGPTFACLLARQFHFLRIGDRFWYENDMPPSSLTSDQLNEIRKSSLARIVCDNGDKTDFVQPSSMISSDVFLNAFQYCSTGTISSLDLNKWKENSRTTYLSSQINKELLETELSRAKRQIDELRLMERNAVTLKRGLAAIPSPQTSHFGFMRTKREAQLINNQSLVLELASNGLVKSLLRQGKDRESGRSLNVDMQDLLQSLPNIDLKDLIDNQISEESSLSKCYESSLPCDYTSQFRTFSGWCNNINNPQFGRSMRIFDRIMPSVYEDGISAPRRKSKSGKSLPSPRIISTTIHDDVSAPHVRYALITMQWGQFLDHDLTFTPMYLTLDGNLLDCKSCQSRKTVHPECWPIPIPKNDNFFPHKNNSSDEKQCLHFVRSLNGQTTLGPREQMNQVTAYVDGSNVYGSNMCEANKLRSFQFGRLNSTRNSKPGLKEFLPQTASNIECKAPSGLCFEAGDVRSSEQPGLASIHTMFLREHNRLVESLQKINPHWNDEQLYQNARRIVSAIMQQITYGEFLPRVIGREHTNRFELSLLPNGYFNDYDAECSGTIFNEIAGAVFRFGHSLLQPHFERLDANYRHIDEPLKLRTAFFNPDMLYSPLAMDNILRGIVTQSIQTLDNAITEEVTNHLLEDLKKPFSGMDLISLNLQRARDHAISPYNVYRAVCNLTKAKTFDDLSAEVPKFLIERFKKLYESVDDIDLFSGGMSETPLHGGLIGPTFGCIIGMQFKRLRKCDRFWYETSNPFVRFTEQQLSQIRKVTLAKILCENSDSIDTIQKQAMDLPDNFLNPRMPCKSLPAIDLSHWRERSGSCIINSKAITIGKSMRTSPCVNCVCTHEGPICQSVRINNCSQLLSAFTRQEVLSDDVCKVQCAFAFSVENIKSSNSKISAIFGFSE